MCLPSEDAPRTFTAARTPIAARQRVLTHRTSLPSLRHGLAIQQAASGTETTLAWLTVLWSASSGSDRPDDSRAALSCCSCCVIRDVIFR